MILSVMYTRKRKGASKFFRGKFWVIGQNVLIKTAVVIVISMATAVISFLKEDTGWTKRVGKIV